MTVPCTGIKMSLVKPIRQLLQRQGWNILEIQKPAEFFMSIKQETQTIPHQFYYCVSSLTE